MHILAIIPLRATTISLVMALGAFFCITIPAHAANGAQCISSSIPSTMTTGESRAVSITFKNTGTVAWTNSPADYDMAITPYPGSAAALNPILLPTLPTTSVTPGQEITYSFTLTAPTTPGTYSGSYRMLQQGVEWFGSPCGPASVTVTAPPPPPPPPPTPTNDSACVGTTIPGTMAPGESRTVIIKFRNTGTATWTNKPAGSPSGDYDIAQTPWPPAAQSISPAGVWSWTQSSSSIQPNQNLSFTFTLTAPTTPGTYPANFRMLEQGVGWFGETCGRTVVVATPAPGTAKVLYWAGNGMADFMSHTLASDSKITRIAITYKNIPQGGSFDYCVDLYKTSEPSYTPFVGGYSEVACWSVANGASTGEWSTNVDLSANPLFIPAGTSIACNSSTGNTAAEQRASRTDCQISYQPYQQGEPRYRVFRLPYIDQSIRDTAPYVGSYYIASDTGRPLKVKGFFSYAGIYSQGAAATLQSCLTHIKQGGALVKEQCAPTVTGVPKTANTQSGNFVPLDWTVPYPDLLGTRCDATNGVAWDCANFAVVEIATSTPKSWENIFRDYGNVPHPFIENYCKARQQTEPKLSTFICPGGTCSDQTAVDKCVALFPLASCMATNSCFNNPLAGRDSFNLFDTFSELLAVSFSGLFAQAR